MIFWRGLPKRRGYKWLCFLFWTIGAAGLYLARQFHLLWLDQGMNVYLVYFLSVFMVYALCRVPTATAWMIGSAGFLAQQICGNLELAFRCITPIARMIDYSSWIVLLDIMFYSSIYLVLWHIFRDNSYQEDQDTSVLQKNMFSFLAALFSLGFYTANQYVRGWQNLSGSELTINALYSSTGGIILLAMQYGLIRQQRLNARFHTMQTLLHVQSSQWQTSKEYTELVNEKYHDLNKLISSFQGSMDPRILQSLQDAVAAYDDHVRTGSQVADVVLTEARELCRRRQIQFTCYVNGVDFDFMDELDLYSLLKNALDNAIEAVENIPENQDRFISLTARQEEDLLIIHCENPCRDVQFTDGLPQTQDDPRYHGFGIKSMMHAAAKYGGMVSCTEASHIFRLDVVLTPGKDPSYADSSASYAAR